MTNTEIAQKLMEMAVELLNQTKEDREKVTEKTDDKKSEEHTPGRQKVEDTGKKKRASRKSSKVQTDAGSEYEEVESPFKADSASSSDGQSEDENGGEESGKDSGEESEAPKQESGTKAPKGVVLYDRESKEQKSIFVNYLTELTGSKDWASDENKEKTRKFSMSLVGKPFLDKEGNILPAFTAACKKHFGI